MATNPYEVEHNIKPAANQRNRRRPDMSSFTSHLHQLSSDTSSTTTAPSRVGPTPVDMAGLFHLLQDQFATLAADAPTEGNRDYLLSLIRVLEADAESPPDHIQGVDQAYLDNLDRVSRKKLQADAEGACPICAERFLDDPYPLVVELPCHGSHTFDLECVGPWLLSKGTCPMCRMDLTKKKTIDIPKDEEDEEEDIDGLYG
ncbi:hypothetical protein F5Y19DRAFT_15915 [Xylariaceae sp. FL1651]|nr:hypothetical protein F5Y19DRAFT_15915 [Xylariaceae sp. FL1651]